MAKVLFSGDDHVKQISVKRLVGILRLEENNRQKVVLKQITIDYIFNKECHDTILGERIIVLSGHYSSREGDVVALNEEKREITVHTQEGRICLSGKTCIGTYKEVARVILNSKD